MKLFVLLLIFVSGCATIVIPPAAVTDGQTVYLTDYGRHSSLLLPARKNVYIEYAYGDYAFFARGDTRWWVALRAMLHSPQATLGRREVVFTGNESSLLSGLGCDKISRIVVSRGRIESLQMRLDNTFRQSPSPPMHSSYAQLDCVPDPTQYWVFHNCNHATADWMRSLNCEIRGTAITSRFTVR